MKKSKRINSRQKGAQGEREFRDVLRAHGYEARRGQQFAGGGDSPDVISSVPGVHWEVKRVQTGNPYKWLAQAIRDGSFADHKRDGAKVLGAPYKSNAIPIVAHRRNGQDWIAVLRMDDLLKLIQGSEGPL